MNSQLVLIEHKGYDTDKLKDDLFDAGLPYLGLSNYSDRALALKAQIEIPKGGEQSPYVMLVENGVVLKRRGSHCVSGICPTVEEIKWVQSLGVEEDTAERTIVPRRLPSEGQTIVIADC